MKEIARKPPMNSAAKAAHAIKKERNLRFVANVFGMRPEEAAALIGGTVSSDVEIPVHAISCTSQARIAFEAAPKGSARRKQILQKWNTLSMGRMKSATWLAGLAEAWTDSPPKSKSRGAIFKKWLKLSDKKLQGAGSVFILGLHSKDFPQTKSYKRKVDKRRDQLILSELGTGRKCLTALFRAYNATLCDSPLRKSLRKRILKAKKSADMHSLRFILENLNFFFDKELKAILRTDLEAAFKRAFDDIDSVEAAEDLLNCLPSDHALRIPTWEKRIAACMRFKDISVACETLKKNDLFKAGHPLFVTAVTKFAELLPRRLPAAA